MSKDNPKEVLQAVDALSKKTFSVLKKVASEIGDRAEKVKSANDASEMAKFSSLVFDEGFKKIANETSSTVLTVVDFSISADLKRIAATPLRRISQKLWFDYLRDAQKIVNRSVVDFINEKSRLDGESLAQRFKTIKNLAKDTVADIVTAGISDGKSSFTIAKEIENFILVDKRKLWTSPTMLAKRADGMPLSLPYKGNPTLKGSVDYNALRIARTEIVNNYNWAKIDSTDGKPWMVGYRRVLSNAHKLRDICDVWAEHNEGSGVGVYRNGKDLYKLRHPHCMCQDIPITVFEKGFNREFEKFNKGDYDKEFKKFEGGSEDS